MAKSANEELLDAMIRHQVYLLRYSGHVRNKVTELLNRSEQDIAEKIRGKLSRGVGLSTPVELQRMQALQKAIASIRQVAWDEANAYFLEEMRALTHQEPIVTLGIVQTTIPVTLSIVMPQPNLLKALVTDKPFEGRTMKQWAQTLADDDIRRIMNAIQLGMVAGEPMDKIARRVVGSGALYGSDGVTQLTRNQIQAVTRTAVQHVANNARSAFMQENADIIKLEQFVATLDSRTTPVCRAQDGERYPVGQGPIPPLHYGCRSIRIAAFDSEVFGDRPANPTTERSLVEEYAQKNGLGDIKKRDNLPRGTKGAFDEWARKRKRELIGPVPTAKNTYQAWLSKQSKEFQDDVLGKTKGKLFRDGGLELTKFVNRNGDELTLRELAAKHAEAFKAAGLDPDKFTSAGSASRTAATVKPHVWRTKSEAVKIQKELFTETRAALKENPGLGNALNRYQRSQYAYSPSVLNKYLRTGETTYNKDIVNSAVTTMDTATSIVRTDVPLYRGAPALGDLKLPSDINEARKLIGAQATEKGFVSTSIAPSGFLSGENQMILFNGTKSGALVMAARENKLVQRAIEKDELLVEGSEFLMRRGGTYRITGVEEMEHPNFKKRVLVYQVEPVQ